MIRAAEKANYEVMELLIVNNADKTKQDKNGCTFFYRLLEARRRPQLSSQLAHDRLEPICDDPNRWDMNGHTLLWWAVEFRDEHMAKALLARGANPNKGDETSSDVSLGLPFLRALEIENHSIASLFARCGGSKDNRISDVSWRANNSVQKVNTSLHRLIEKGQFIDKNWAQELLRRALGMGFDANEKDSKGKTPLYYAIDGGDENFAFQIIDNLKFEALNATEGMDKGKTPLLFALEKKKRNIVRSLVQHGAVINLSHWNKWFELGGEGTRYIQFSGSQKSESMEFEFIEQPPTKDDWLPGAMGNVFW